MFENVIVSASPFVGLFLSVRFNAFIFQCLGTSYNSWVHIVAAAFFFIAALFFRKSISVFLDTNAYGLGPFSITIYLMSILCAHALRNTFLYSAIEGTDMKNPFVLVACLIGCGLLLGLFALLFIRAIKMAVLPMLREFTKLKAGDWLYIVGLLLCLNLITWLYIHFSRTVYFWDNAGYWTTTHALAETAKAGLGPLISEVYSSVTATDYNYLVALPGTILCILFGKSRFVFVAGIMNVYVFPLLVLIFMYIHHRWKRSKIITTATVLFVPAPIYLSLIGFVDIAGTIPCFLAIIFYFAGKKKDPGCYIVAGCLLALAILLRRWYIFFALSFALCIVIDTLIYRRSPLPVFATLCPMLFILLFFFQKFVSYRLLADYGSMYAAYQLGLRTDFMLLFRYFGILPIAAILAFAIYDITQSESRRQSLFMLIQPIICFVLFISIQTHGQQHLLLYLPAFYFFIACAFGKLLSTGRKYIFTTVVPLFLTAYCLLPRVKPASILDIKSPALIADFSFVPDVRPDIDDLLELAAYMDSLVGGKDKNMAVLSSSLVLNRSVLTNLEISLSIKGGDDIDRSYLLDLPAVDSRDSLPLDILSWDYVLVASPVQVHLDEENQRVVTVPAESFLKGIDISAAYKKLPKEFILTDSSIEIYIYEKTRDVTEGEYREYSDRLRDALPGKFE